MSEPLHIDWETRSEVDLRAHGLDLYSRHSSTEVISAAWAWGDGPVQCWDITEAPLPPLELKEAFEDSRIEKWGFNFTFERVIAKRVLGWKVPYKNTKCTMALANMQSFTGTLGQIGVQIGLDENYQKDKEGDRLIKLFCMPQKITKTNPFVWRDALTDPEDWRKFVKVYNPQDVVAERAMKKRLIRFPIQDVEWELYALDQLINDRGFPIDREFMVNGIDMAARRKAELIDEMISLTDLANPNSTAQLIPWLQALGYPFADLRKDTVRKVITEHEEAVKRVLGDYYSEEDTYGIDDGGMISAEAHEALRLRQWAARTSTQKLNALQKALHTDDRFRFGFQFAGAARTSRWSGRRFQPHNLMRPPKSLEPLKPKDAAKLGVEPDYALANVTNLIRTGDYDGLSLTLKEPMEGLTGVMRSSIRTPEHKRLVVADLSSIETRVTAWLSRCTRLLSVVREGLDPYIDFATELYEKPYEEVTKRERQDSKPAVLGCTYRLGGGFLRDGKRTGLWGYAESMGVNITQAQSIKSVQKFRGTYVEVPELWYALERAIKWTIRSGQTTEPNFRMNGESIKVPVEISYDKPYLLVRLPSGRCLYYHLPRLTLRTFYGFDGEPYDKEVISYMGQSQITKKWGRVESHGGKFTENIVQAIARDILTVGLLRAHKEGFVLIGHVHDELICEQKTGDNFYTDHRLAELMADEIAWCPDLPLGAEGYTAEFYRK